MPPLITTSETAPALDAGDPGAPIRYGKALTMLASLFFMWGFITVINNTLLPHLRSVFDLSYTQTTLIESVWFIAYFVASIPAAKLIEAVGYQRAMVVGLIIMAAGAVGMMGAASIPSYGVTLVMLFAIACGITVLQVAANPYVAVVGRPETASSRLNLVQALNSAGTMLAPLFGAYLILGRSKSGTSANGVVLTPAERLADAHSVILPYALVAVVLVVLAVAIARFPLPAMTSPVSRDKAGARTGFWNHPLWQHRNLVLGVPAIFIYLIAEIGVANLFVNFVSRPDIGNMTHERAGHYLALLWGGMMVGRLGGDAAVRCGQGAGGVRHGGLRGDGDHGVHSWADGDVGADFGGIVPLDHVPDDLYVGDQGPGPADRGRRRLAGHGDRRRGAGGGAGLDRGPVRPAGLVPADRRLRALRAVLCVVGCPPHACPARRSAGLKVQAAGVIALRVSSSARSTSTFIASAAASPSPTAIAS